MVVVFSLFRDVVVHVQHQFKFVNAEFRYEIGGECQRSSFARGSNRVAACESLPVQFNPVHDDGSIHVFVGFAGPNVGKLTGYGHGLTRVGLGRVERKTSVVQGRCKVHATVGNEGVPKENIDVPVAIDVGNSGGGPDSVGHAQRCRPCIVDVG